ncbi:hypothetical protein EON65_44055 [archaeon]|nr:MAG: hypothetical protein EON65_44055 [archaeon]
MPTHRQQGVLLRTFGNTVEVASTAGAIGRMFFTGITPMAFAGTLSGLNMVDDISDYPAFSTLMGLIRKDLEDALDKMGITDKDLRALSGEDAEPL